MVSGLVFRLRTGAHCRRSGCNELIFNPLIEWWRRGPINKQLHVFLWSDAPVHYKVTMTSYMFSYCKFLPLSLLAVSQPSS